MEDVSGTTIAPDASMIHRRAGDTDTAAATRENAPGKRLPSKASRQRFKPQLSCTFCRTRKLKCDRASPCTNCMKRDISSSCTYLHTSPRQRPAHVQRDHGRAKDVQERIRHLEELVITLMNRDQPKNAPTQPPQHTPPPPLSSNTVLDADAICEPREDDPISETIDRMGRVSLDDKHEQQFYIGGGHWAAILENIAGLKDSIGIEEWPRGTAPVEKKYRGPELLIGDTRPASRESILACLPTKEVIDRSIDYLYVSLDGAALVVHGPTFRKEYAEFWENPDSKSIAWIGLLYSILCLVANFEYIHGDNAGTSASESIIRDPADRVKIFRAKTVQCLVMSNYTEPGAYTVETLCFYYFSEGFMSKDTLFGTWMVFGIIVRAAMRLGFHRDASNYPNISVFRGEMQRRLWSCIVHLDNLSSCQVGLPRMINEGMSDTKPPRLILEEDLFETMESLPPARAGHEASSIGHALAKSTIAVILEKIADAGNSVISMGYDEVLKLDNQLSDAHQNLPNYYKACDVNDLASSSITQTIRKIFIELLYLKTRLFLHRKFLVLPESLQVYEYSVKVCVESSLDILRYQKYLHYQAVDPKQSMFVKRWISSSLTTHDFLLSATLLCLYLGKSIDAADKDEDRPSTFSIEWGTDDILQALLGSYQIWTDPEHSSDEMTKFAKVLKAMLQKVGKWPSAQDIDKETVEKKSNDPNFVHTNTNSAPTNESIPCSLFNAEPIEDLPFDMDMMGDFMNDNMDFNWVSQAITYSDYKALIIHVAQSLWDSNFQGSSSVDTGMQPWSTNTHMPFQADAVQDNVDWKGLFTN
ncbi:C6 transcription factor protein [Rutstroemia sp. NJR-2017a BVV2]|nr:C6 transcription factor protein [Rutstroemia sp. NJR-2017a BVV2]